MLKVESLIVRSMFGAGGADPALADPTVHIFSVASGHLYERLLKIMILAVRKHTEAPLKFWFLKQFLSPQFKVRSVARSQLCGCRGRRHCVSLTATGAFWLGVTPALRQKGWLRVRTGCLQVAVVAEQADGEAEDYLGVASPGSCVCMPRLKSSCSCGRAQVQGALCRRHLPPEPAQDHLCRCRPSYIVDRGISLLPCCH